MIVKFAFEGVSVAAIVVAAISVYKHHGLSAAVASAKKELAVIEAAVVKVEATAKADVLSAVARIKALF